MKIVGSGLLGKAFEDSGLSEVFDGYVVIASGVSNSKETSSEAFEREISLVRHECVLARKQERKVVYISTYSIRENMSGSKMYVEAKLFCENIVFAASENNIVIRLTNVIGHGGNSNNILNFLFHKVVENEPLIIYRGVKRNFVDVEDVPRFLEHSLKTFPDKRLLHLVHPFSYRIEHLVEAISEFTGKPARVERFDTLPNNDFRSSEESDSFFTDVYSDGIYSIKELLEKYYMGSRG